MNRIIGKRILKNKTKEATKPNRLTASFFCFKISYFAEYSSGNSMSDTNFHSSLRSPIF